MEHFVVEATRRGLVNTRAAQAVGALVLGLLLAASPLAAQDRPFETDGLVHVPSTQVWLAPPEGFAAATTFTGFLQAETSSSIMVSSLQAAFAETRLVFEDPKRLAKNGMERLAGADRNAGKYPGILVHVRQRVPAGEFEKWVWVFGSEHETVTILGIYPRALADEYGPMLREAVLSARWDPLAEVSSFDVLGFSLTYTGSLEFFSRMANTISYTEDGDADVEKLGKASFLFGPAFAAVDAGDRRSFAQQRLRKLAKHSGFQIESIDAVTIDALQGFEIVATAVSDSEVPTTVYQVILFDGSSYWIGVGMVRSSERQEFLPMFRKMGRGFVRDRIVFESENGLLRVTAPGGWATLELHDDADLELAHPTADCYLIVLSEPMTDFEEGTTVEDHSEMTRDGLRAGGGIESEAGPHRLEIDGLEAVQYELHTESDGNVFVMLHTTFASAEHFHQVLAWTGAAGFAQKRATLDALIASIELID